MQVTLREIGNVLTRTTGFLKTVTSHSLQPYSGCTFGNSLCGVGCYVRHNSFVTRGGPGEVFWRSGRTPPLPIGGTGGGKGTGPGAAGEGSESSCPAPPSPFCPTSSATGSLNGSWRPCWSGRPTCWCSQTHSHRVADYSDLYLDLSQSCRLRVHVSIETDRAAVPGLPRHASSVDRRFEAAQRLRRLGLFTVITVSPLLPIRDPERFFRRVGESADRVVLDHFVEGDGTPDGSRTLKTGLPRAMKQIDGSSIDLAYRDRMVQVAQDILPGRVGVSIDGFAGRYLTSSRPMAEHV